MNKRRSESFNRRKVFLDHPFASLPSVNMLKINQHTTTLSKALLTAGLLGGAALSTLGAGSAQAAWTPTTSGYSCLFNGACTVNEQTPVLFNDKQLTLKAWNSIPTLSDLEFSYQPSDPVTPWHVDLDFNPDDSDGGSLTYKIESFMDDFNLVNFISARDGGTSATKVYGTGYDVVTDTILNPIDTLLLTANNADMGPAFGKVLYVKDTWSAGTFDNLSNEFSQVPAPLPILGAGAAFGSIRKLRKFSTRLKTFSMN